MWRAWIPFWHAGVSPHSGDVDLLFTGLLLASSLVLGLLFFLLALFCVRYRAGNRIDRGDRVAKSWYWEVSWTAASLFAFLGLFIWGASLFLDTYRTHADELSIFVVAKQWMWKVQHQNGAREINALHVPVGEPVRLAMTSEDVIHSFFAPEFRIKQDVLPGRYTRAWFNATKAGVYHLFCTQLCGTEHARMIGDIVAMDPADFARWIATQPHADDIVREGRALFSSLGCSACHDGGPKQPAPRLEGVYGQPVELADGSRAMMDDAFIRDIILQPAAHAVRGYDAIMPSYSGLVGDDELLRLCAYIRSLAQAGRGGRG
jgi:cytochrome c oxidase subunit II